MTGKSWMKTDSQITDLNFPPFIVSVSNLTQDSSYFVKESDSEIKLQPSKTSSDTEQLIPHIIAPYSLDQTKRLYI